MKTDEVSVSNGVTVGIVGLGRVGTAMALACLRAGVPVSSVFDTDERNRDRYRKLVSAPVDESAKSFRRCSIILIAVSDSQIQTARNSLLSHTDLCPGTVIAHTNGSYMWDTATVATGPGVLHGSIHPLMAFPSNPLHARSFSGIGFAIDGPPDAQKALDSLVHIFGGIPLRIPPDKKTPYHAAAVFTSNFPVLLYNIALEILRSGNLDDQKIHASLNSLLDSARHNLSLELPRHALSGPAARGDMTAITRHIESLETMFPEYARLYRTLTDAIFDMLKQKS